MPNQNLFEVGQRVDFTWIHPRSKKVFAGTGRVHRMVSGPISIPFNPIPLRPAVYELREIRFKDFTVQQDFDLERLVNSDVNFFSANALTLINEIANLPA